jgi:hypothetical protein
LKLLLLTEINFQSSTNNSSFCNEHFAAVALLFGHTGWQQRPVDIPV